jgi:hypothetical protein
MKRKMAKPKMCKNQLLKLKRKLSNQLRKIAKRKEREPIVNKRVSNLIRKSQSPMRRRQK